MIKNCNNCKFFHDPLKTGSRYVCGAVDKRDCKHALNALSLWQPILKRKKQNTKVDARIDSPAAASPRAGKGEGEKS